MASAPIMTIAFADVGIAAFGSTSHNFGKGKCRKIGASKNIEIWRCRCGKDGAVKIVQPNGRYQIFCRNCLP